MSKRDIRARPSRINIPHHQQHETQAPHGRSRDAGTPVSASFRAPSRTSSLKPTIPTTSPRRGMSLGSSLRTPVRATRSTGRSQFFNQEIPVVVSPTQSIPVDAGSNSGMNADRDSDDDDEDEDLALVEPFAMPAPTPAEIAADRLRLRTTYDPQNPPPDDPIIAEGTALGVIADLEGRKWLEQLLRLNRWATSGHISYVSGQYGPPESCTVDQLRPQERRVLDLDFQRAPIVSRRPVKGGKGRKDTREYWAKRDKILSAGVRKRRVQMTTTTAATRPQRFGAFFGAPTFGGEALRTPPSRSTPLAQAFGDWIGENYQASGSTRAVDVTQSAATASTTKISSQPQSGPSQAMHPKSTRTSTSAPSVHKPTFSNLASKPRGPLQPARQPPSQSVPAASAPQPANRQPTSQAQKTGIVLPHAAPAPSSQQPANFIPPPVEVPAGMWDAPEYILPVGRPSSDETMANPTSRRVRGPPRSVRTARVGPVRISGSDSRGRGSGNKQGKAVSWAPLPGEEGA